MSVHYTMNPLAPRRRPRRPLGGYRCASCGVWAPADRWDDPILGPQRCPTCLRLCADERRPETRSLVVEGRPSDLHLHLHLLTAALALDPGRGTDGDG